MENNQQNKSINKGRPVYFSYARNSIRKPEWEHISDCVTKMLDIFSEQNIEYRVDVRNIGSGDKISDFEKEIGWNSEVVILVISDKYFRSLHCMYEFVQIKQALKKHPEKRLICLKSGNVDLSDQKYMMEVEHYLGDQKQEYETIDFHQLRSHSETEKAAFKNGFYLNEIRTIKSFFNNYTLYDADTDNFAPIINEITNYYTTTKKSFLLRIQERKAKFAKLRSFILGYSLLWIIVGLMLGFIIYASAFRDRIILVDYPDYQENCYVHNEEVFTTVTKFTVDTLYTTVYFRSTNLTDDTMRRVDYDTVNTRLDRMFVRKPYPLLEIGGINNQPLPEYYPGGKGATVEYYMKFKPIGGFDFDFLTDNPNHCIYEIKERLNHETEKTWFSGWIVSNPNCLTVEHPEYSQGIKNMFVKQIEIRISGETTLIFHMINPSTNDTTLFSPNGCYIVAKGDTLKCISASGIKTNPYKSIAYKKSATEFSLFFSPINYNTTDSIDFVINDSTKICGLKLRKHNYSTVENPIVSGYNFGGANVTKVEIDSTATVIHFRYTNSFKNNPIFARASQRSYIQANGKKYPIQNASGIAFQSGMTMIPPHSSLDYGLIFPPIPPETETINFVNTEFSREQTGDQRFRALIYLLGSECANETGDTISTGSFGIKLK